MEKHYLPLDLYASTILIEKLVAEAEASFKIRHFAKVGYKVYDLQSDMLSSQSFTSYEEAYEKAIFHYCPDFHVKRLALPPKVYGSLLNFRNYVSLKADRNQHVEYLQMIANGELQEQVIETEEGYVKAVDFAVEHGYIDVEYEPYYIIASRYLLDALKCKHMDIEKALDIYIPYGLFSR